MDQRAWGGWGSVHFVRPAPMPHRALPAPPPSRCGPTGRSLSAATSGMREEGPTGAISDKVNPPPRAGNVAVANATIARLSAAPMIEKLALSATTDAPAV